MSGTERTLDSAPGAATLYPRAAFGTFARPLLRKVPLVGGSTPKALPELTLGLDDVALDAGHVADYARVCGFDLRDTLPASYLHILGFPLAMSLMTDGAFPFGVIGLVHVANRIDHLRPVSLGETPSLRVHAEDLRDHPKGRQFDVVAVATVGGERVWEGRSTYLRIGGGSGRRRDQGRQQVRACSPRPEPEAIWQIPADIGRRYGAVSGDRNPIHLHNVSAKLFGMPRAIAHGMWLKARVLAALQSELPESFTAEVRFKRPVLLPANVAFSTDQSEQTDALSRCTTPSGVSRTSKVASAAKTPHARSRPVSGLRRDGRWQVAQAASATSSTSATTASAGAGSRSSAQQAAAPTTQTAAQTHSASCRPPTNALWSPPPKIAPDGISAPSAATPTAMPAWRNVSLTPAARPLCSLGDRAQRDAADRRVEQPGADHRDERARAAATVQDESTCGERQQRHADADEHEPDRRPSPRPETRSASALVRARDEEHHDRRGQVDQAGLDRRQARAPAAGRA